MSKLWLCTFVLLHCAAWAERPAIKRAQPYRAASESPGQMVSGPVLGFLAEGLELRAISGVPGAASLSEPIELPAGASALALAPGHDWALVQRHDAAPLAWNLKTGSLTDLPNFPSAPELIAFSPAGDALAAYDSRSRSLKVIGGLPAAPRTLAEPVESSLPRDIVRISVSDSGALAVAARDGGVYRVQSGLAPIRIYDDAASIAFLPSSKELLISVTQAGKVVAVDIRTGASRVIFETESPLEAWAETQGIVMVRSRGKLWQVDVLHGVATEQEVAFDSAERLRIRGLHLLKSEASLLLYEGSAEGRISVLPGGRPAAGEIQ